MPPDRLPDSGPAGGTGPARTRLRRRGAGPALWLSLALSLTLAAATLTVDGVRAAPAAPADAAADRNALARIEVYLNGLTTVSGRFRQINPDGSQSAGKFWMRRPGRMRFEYAPPVPITVMSDGSWLYEIDSELRSVGQYPLSATPARFFLGDEISLSDNVAIAGVRREQGRVSVVLMDPENPDDGTVRLSFADSPLELRAWTVTDWRGEQTVVTLQDTRFGSPLAPELFKFTHPFLDRESGS